MRTLCGALLAALVVCCIGGCAGGGGGGNEPDTTGPTLSAVSATPSALDISGGAVALQVTATDPSGVASLVFHIVAPSGAVDRAGVNQGSGVYTFSYTAAANIGATELTYTVTAVATDGEGNSRTSAATTFTVDAPSGPPPPPI